MRSSFLLVLVTAFSFCSQLPAVELKVGDAAPSFETTADDGKAWKSSDHVGKKVLVLYFYPADFTGGCTKQACAYRDDSKKLTDIGVDVVGISADSVHTHQLFKKEYKLPFTLLADEKGDVAKMFGVPVKSAAGKAKAKVDGKEMEVERSATIQRWTFIVGKDGKIAYIDNKVAPTEDSKKIAEVVEKLNK